VFQANEQERAVFLFVCFLSALVWGIFSTLEISFLLFEKEFREGWAGLEPAPTRLPGVVL
jgi:hypothetical protein